MIEIAMLNVSRVTKYWEVVNDHLIELSNSKDSAIRNFGVESTTHLIGTALALKLTSHMTYSDTPLALQDQFFQTLEKLAQSAQPEIQEKSLQTLLQILHASGQV
jgi:hypothetical protein